jgi:phenylacetate-CoA ligase
MPLIRYRLGDRGNLSETTSICKCGRALPLIASISGRVDDVLYTKDGRRIGRLDPVFKADLPIQEAQIVQDTLSNIRVRYVPAYNCSPDVEQSLAARLRDRMGPVDVTFERLMRIPRDASGKFRPVICAIPKDARPLDVRDAVAAGKVS